MYVLGVDPGLNGGLTLLPIPSEESHMWSYAYRVMPTTENDKGKREICVKEIISWFEYHLSDSFRHQISLACIEQVSSRPKQGVVSVFTFGKGYGKILGLLEAHGIRVVEVNPRKWKNEILPGTDKDKDAAISYVYKHWPSMTLMASERSRVPHDGIADSVCIAEYGLRLLKEEETRRKENDGIVQGTSGLRNKASRNKKS